MAQCKEYLGTAFAHRAAVALYVDPRVQIESHIETHRPKWRLKAKTEPGTVGEIGNGEIRGALKDIAGIVKKSTAQLSD